MSEWIHAVIQLSVLLLAIVQNTAGLEEICSGETFRASCQTGEVIIMDTAEYGRMEAGPCGVTREVGHVGCKNDFLPLLDAKCSGRQECMVSVGNNEFYDANTQCIKELRSYLKVSYSCIKVEYKDRSHCLVPKKLPLFPHEGFIAGQVTDETGCGTITTPWTIDAMPGQTINLALYDFSALSRGHTSHYVKCQDTYGFIIERSLNVNESICGSNHREHRLYSSATHSMEIQLIPRNRHRDSGLFLIRYRVEGCSDLTPPANSFYNREGNEAVIGCDGTDITWRLQCHGNTWSGFVGNCTAKIAAVASQKKDEPLPPWLYVLAIVGATVVIAVLIIVSGVVYINKFRHAEGVRANTMQWTLHYQSKPGMPPTQPPKGGTYRPMTCTHARPVDPPTTSRAPTLAKPRRPPPSTGTGKPLQHIWEMPLPDPHAKKETPSESIYMNPTECTCTNTPAKPPDGAVGDGDDVSSFYAPNTGHKYYVLERQDPSLPPPPPDL